MINRIAKASGIDAEKEAAWHIERQFGNIKNYRVLHNIIIPDHRSSSPCQIDHLVIGRFWDFLVLETKSTKNGCAFKESNQTWSRIHNGRPQPMPSPIEQNKRHIQCLKAFLQNAGVLPKRGIQAKPIFHNWILVDPGSDVPPTFENARLIPRDMFGSVAQEWVDKHGISIRNFINLMTVDQLDKVDEALRPHTQPQPYRLEQAEERPTLPELPVNPPSEKPEQPHTNDVETPTSTCQECGTPVERNPSRTESSRFLSIQLGTNGETHPLPDMPADNKRTQRGQTTCNARTQQGNQQMSGLPKTR
jgi:Nuclease-related domain